MEHEREIHARHLSAPFDEALMKNISEKSAIEFNK